MKTATRCSLVIAVLGLGALCLSAADKIVNTLIVPDGTTGDVISPDAIETTARTTPASDPLKVVIHPGGDSIFWARTRIILRDGFKATGGYTTVYEAGQPVQKARGMVLAIDSNGNGYSDMEEATDTDLDGLVDAWEYDRFGSLGAATGGQDSDSDGLSNLEEYQRGLNPTDRSDGPIGFPGGSNFRVIVKTPPHLGPGYFGVNRTSWGLSSTAP